MALQKFKDAFDVSRVGKSRGDGDREFSNVLLGTSLLVNRKPLGQMRVAGDDSTGRLGVPNPLFTGNGSSNAHAGAGGVFHLQPGYREHFRHWQKVRRGYDSHVNFTQELKTWTPMPTPNFIPVGAQYTLWPR